MNQRSPPRLSNSESSPVESVNSPTMARIGAGPIILYDGECGFCSRSIAWILRRDRAGVFRYAALGSEIGRALLEEHGLPSADPNSVILVTADGAYARSDAALEIVRRLRLPWRALGVLRWIPRPLRDAAYRVFARHRYRFFGKADACSLPAPELRKRFLDR
jgi:predicted DCC family thiol-disulfide oxidoreductase YuxK